MSSIKLFLKKSLYILLPARPSVLSSDCDVEVGFITPLLHKSVEQHDEPVGK